MRLTPTPDAILCQRQAAGQTRGGQEHIGKQFPISQLGVLLKTAVSGPYKY
jgi:hypothetical protein